MAIALASRNWEPLSEMNTTPLIDVLLVLLIVLMMSVPIATHSLEGGGEPGRTAATKTCCGCCPDRNASQRSSGLR